MYNCSNNGCYSSFYFEFDDVHRKKPENKKGLGCFGIYNTIYYLSNLPAKTTHLLMIIS